MSKGNGGLPHPVEVTRLRRVRRDLGKLYWNLEAELKGNLEHEYRTRRLMMFAAIDQALSRINIVFEMLEHFADNEPEPINASRAAFFQVIDDFMIS